MVNLLDLTGTWVGYYLQHSRPRALSAALVQDGAKLTGTMRDHDTHFEATVTEFAAEAGLAPGADEQIVSGLRQLFPDASSGSMRYITELPSDSNLEGRVEGQQVSFLKTYEGAQVSGYRVGERGIGSEIPNHQVHYRGQVTPDGGEISGSWWIEPTPRMSGTHRTEGTFVLRRRPSQAAAASAEAPVVPPSKPPWWKFWRKRRNDRAKQ